MHLRLWMRLWGMVFLGLWLGFTGQPALAATLRDGEQAFAAGRFPEAIAIGRDLDSADGDTLVARSALVEAAYLAPADKRLTYLADAEAAARKALSRDPDHVEAMLHLVIALGYRARIMGKMAAHRAGLAKEAKHLIDRTIELDPGNPWAWAVLGGWHGEIVASGGFFGALVYGARADQVDMAFAKAMALDPKNPALMVEYAKMLLRLDRRKNAARVRMLLTTGPLRPPRTAFEHILADQAVALLAALDSGKSDDVKAVLGRIVPFSK